MAARSIWKGYLRLSLVNCSVALYPAVTQANKVRFHKLNRKTGHRLRMRMVDEETGREVPRDEQVKGYQISKREMVEVEEEDLGKIALEATHVMEITKFVPREEIDPLYFDRPYYLAPTDDASQEAFAVMREAMRKQEIGGLATVIMHERDHVLLIEPREEGMMATMLRSEEEVRNPKDAFANVEKTRVSRELLEVAQMLIEKKMGKFDPSEFKDHYEAALKNLLKAKKAGREIKEVQLPEGPTKPSSVLEALRESLKQGRAHARRARGGRRGTQRTAARRTGRTTARKRA
jgi:DNA end-binding protein Ku